MKEFRQLTVEDTAEYHKVLIDGYAAIKDFPITFDAIDFTEEESKEWIETYPVYGLYIDGQLVSSITFCMPWVKYSTPDKFPHIGCLRCMNPLDLKLMIKYILEENNIQRYCLKKT